MKNIQILNRLRLLIQYDQEKVFDKDIARILQITPNKLALCISRDKLPIDEILTYCEANKVSLNWVFYGVGHYHIDS